MNIQHNETLREKLASEYVLGTLKDGARRRFESWLNGDAALRRAVAEWQDRLYPLAELAPAAIPSAQVWRAIEKRLNQQETMQQPRWRERLDFWRYLGMASSAVAALLLVVLLVRQPQGDIAAASYVAVLSDNNAQTVMVVTGHPQRHQMTIKMVTPQQLADDKSLELWALPKDDAPRSLGLLAANGVVTLTLPDNMPPNAVPALAVSLEPKGGSPNPNAPSGPVLYKGAWVQI
ncbi:MAG: anti-sigma factor [Proteobacteria bacterium]|nr:anti-sigma factor [Pseudomonadota bacterium]